MSTSCLASTYPPKKRKSGFAKFHFYASLDSQVRFSLVPQTHVRAQIFTIIKTLGERDMKTLMTSALALTLGASLGFADAVPTKEAAESAFGDKPYSPYANRDVPLFPLWGETHLHTGLSLDAGAFGNILGPDDAWRFAKGEQVISSTGQPVKLSRPLDWMVLTDHTDLMGFAPDLQAGKPGVLADPKGREWYEGYKKGGEEAGKPPLT